MLISNDLNTALNRQIGRELLASNQYVQMAAFFDSLGLKLLKKMFLNQASEERDHAMKFLDYVMSVGGAVEIPALDAPRTSFSNTMQAFETALQWELDIRGHINDLMTLATEEKDYAAQDLLRWFITEQIEEVSTMGTLVTVLRQVNGNPVMVEAYLVHGG